MAMERQLKEQSMETVQEDSESVSSSLSRSNSYNTSDWSAASALRRVNSFGSSVNSMSRESSIELPDDVRAAAVAAAKAVGNHVISQDTSNDDNKTVAIATIASTDASQIQDNIDNENKTNLQNGVNKSSSELNPKQEVMLDPSKLEPSILDPSKLDSSKLDSSTLDPSAQESSTQQDCNAMANDSQNEVANRPAKCVTFQSDEAEKPEATKSRSFPDVKSRKKKFNLKFKRST